MPVWVISIARLGVLWRIVKTKSRETKWRHISWYRAWYSGIPLNGRTKGTYEVCKFFRFNPAWEDLTISHQVAIRRRRRGSHCLRSNVLASSTLDTKTKMSSLFSYNIYMTYFLYFAVSLNQFLFADGKQNLFYF